ncbi:hypothetical protein LMH87_001515 [Akanthomyces muscarius]|uniref:Prion-inhibition and propagation HeLo domain-containing protein n=1 Tax=Akanthomyces muscarius TaxID=2231603 RepID=A0A9W8UI95_AKAMU|nr:hypothetical protein LMH87_001515 [Akanthomyces muscarius]KAJ4146962.1 hypothetical protein LMH87_001515 [Akanthomyces muscarius]
MVTHCVPTLQSSVGTLYQDEWKMNRGSVYSIAKGCHFTIAFTYAHLLYNAGPNKHHRNTKHPSTLSCLCKAMEPVGLAVGVLGLAGLFSTCLDAIGRFESWRNFADESQLVRTLLEGQRLLLQRWGRDVGLDNGTLSADHHEALNDPKILSTIRMHLSEIEKICTNEDGAFLLSGGTTAGQKSGARFLRTHPEASALPESRRQKMKLCASWFPSMGRKL